jgi:transglutaminase-like putative cysteine protease
VRRTAALYVVPALLIATGWLRLDDRADDSAPAALLLLALLPALARPWWGRALGALGASLAALHLVYGLSWERDLVPSLASRFREGVLSFYDVSQPFSGTEHPLMHDVTLVAIFGFALAVALLLAARRPIAASVVLLLGSVWPVALVPGSDLARGAVLLATVLLLLAFGGRRPTRAPRPALAAAALLVVAAVGASTSAAVAKPQLVAWKQWDLYDKPPKPVGVGYVWDATYQPFEWPEERTTVLKVSGPQRNLYWRATTLDTFTRDRWIEELPTVATVEGTLDVTRFPDALRPGRANDVERWTRSEVEVVALRDDHLVAASMPVAYDPKSLGALRLARGGVAFAADDVPQGAEYTVWSYAPSPAPEQLARVPELDFDQVRRYLEVAPGLAVPTFGTPDRDATVESLLDRTSTLEPYRAVFERARAVVGNPTNQYAAVVGLEAWFRSQGGFTYDESPPAPGALPPLVAFLEHQHGYCQFYGGAMTLMLRYLGIPARVAVGFTSGTLSEDNKTWAVTDHDAHAWVEVWFPGWGWLPFDPTPARGQLSSPYSYGGINFDAAGAGRVLDASGFGGEDAELTRRIRGLSERKAGEDTGSGVGGYAPIVRERGASLLKLLALIAAAAAAAIMLVKRVVRGRRYLTKDARRLAGACRQELADFLADQGMELPRSATPRELARELDRSLGVDAREFARALAGARYAPARDSRAAGRRLRRELRGLRRAIRGRLGVPRRVRGAVSLRSLAA